MDRLRCHQRALGVRLVRIHIGKEVGEDRNDVERDQDDRPAHRKLVLAEAPPHELPLRGDGDALRRYCLPRRILGSTHMRRRSEMKVPMTVMTPSSRTMVPARNMSWAIKAFRSRGPTVGRLRTSETMMLPETM